MRHLSVPAIIVSSWLLLSLETFDWSWDVWGFISNVLISKLEAIFFYLCLFNISSSPFISSTFILVCIYINIHDAVQHHLMNSHLHLLNHMMPENSMQKTLVKSPNRHVYVFINLEASACLHVFLGVLKRQADDVCFCKRSKKCQAKYSLNYQFDVFQAHTLQRDFLRLHGWGPFQNLCKKKKWFGLSCICHFFCLGNNATYLSDAGCLLAGYKCWTGSRWELSLSPAKPTSAH